MDIFNAIAERKIHEAIQDGLLDNLSGSGRPLLFDDESWIPGGLRITYRLLKSAGFIPLELEERKEIVNLRDLIKTLDDNAERLAKLRELNYRIMKLNMIRERQVNMDDESRIVERLIKADD
jgi:hypothetical protein